MNVTLTVWSLVNNDFSMISGDSICLEYDIVGCASSDLGVFSDLNESVFQVGSKNGISA